MATYGDETVRDAVMRAFYRLSHNRSSASGFFARASDLLANRQLAFDEGTSHLQQLQAGLNHEIRDGGFAVLMDFANPTVSAAFQVLRDRWPLTDDEYRPRMTIAITAGYDDPSLGPQL